MIVLDTNVVSELMCVSPATRVLTWLGRQASVDMFTTAITVVEVCYGIVRLPQGRRRNELAAAADEVFGASPEQILPFDRVAASAYAGLVASREGAGSPIDGFDAQIAAICRVHRGSLATRNGTDFRDTAVR